MRIYEDVPCQYKDEYETCERFVERANRRKNATCETCKNRIRSQLAKKWWRQSHPHAKSYKTKLST